MLGQRIAEAGAIVHSGGADGADTAFAQGACTLPEAELEIILPFNGRILPVRRAIGNHAKARLTVFDPGYLVHQRWVEVAKKVHPNFNRLAFAGRCYHSRNSGIMMGNDLEGSQQVSKIWAFPSVDRRGGTEQSFRLAKYLNIPIVNLREEYVHL